MRQKANIFENRGINQHLIKNRDLTFEKEKPKACCIVDPFVSSEIIRDALIASGVWPIAILTDQLHLTSEEQNKRFAVKKFQKVLQYDSTQGIDFADQLQELNIIAVIAGNERTCHLADLIASELAPTYANSPTTSHFRMDKFEMQEGVREANLSYIKQIKLQSPTLASTEKDFVSQFDFPIILKPTNQSGSVGVARCETITELEVALHRVLGLESKYGNKVDACVAQECITGEEYFVDTVSLHGQHKVISIYRCPKILYQQFPIYRFIEVIDPNSPQAQVCISYVKKVLSALDVKYGMAHTEIFLTDKGPELIEINPRICGAHGFPTRLASLTSGQNQAEFLAKSLTDEVGFLAEIDEIPALNSYGLIVFLQSWVDKEFKSFAENTVKQLKSYHSHKILKPLNQPISAPKDLLDTVAIVMLVNPDREQVQRDYVKLIELEKSDSLFG